LAGVTGSKTNPKLDFKRAKPTVAPVPSAADNRLGPSSVQSPPKSLLSDGPAATPPPSDLPTAPTAKKKASPKKGAAKKPDAKKKKKKEKEKQHLPTVSYAVYRDQNPLPIDPRKPGGICTNPNLDDGCDCGGYRDIPGRHGKPYQEREPGGSRCTDKKCGERSAVFSAKWPRPFSAKLDEHFPKRAAERYCPCQKKRIVDVYDRFIDFKLINYQRHDNGYCGDGADPYGCLSESRMVATGVSAVGHRFSPVPVDRSATPEPADTN